MLAPAEPSRHHAQVYPQAVWITDVFRPETAACAGFRALAHRCSRPAGCGDGLTPPLAAAPRAVARVAGGAVVHSREEAVTNVGFTLTAHVAGPVFHG